MPLGAISTINTTLNNLQKGVENRESPLALIEKRRQQRAAEALKKRELEIKDKEAEIMAKNAATKAATEARTAGGELAVSQEMARINKLYGPTAPQGTPEYLYQQQKYYQAISTSPVPDVAKLGATLSAQLPTHHQMTPVGGNLRADVEGDVDVRKKAGEAYQAETQGQLNASLYNKPPAAPSKELMAVAFERLKKADPGVWWKFNKKDDQELAIEAQRLASYYQQVKTQYAARSGGQIMPEDDAWDAAEALLVQRGAGAESAGMPPQMAPQAPQMPPPPQYQQPMQPQQPGVLPPSQNPTGSGRKFIIPRT
jgi:hypothetical protein